MPDSALFDEAGGALEAHAPAHAVLPIACRGIVVARNGRRLLDDVDVSIDGSGLTAVVGPNGAGKTLLLRILANLFEPDQGEVRWAHAPPCREHAPKIGFVFQKPVMLRRSVLANVAYALAAAGVAKHERSVRALEVLAMASLEHLAHSPARALSGGEQQRLALARAMATEPEVLLLDEPSSSLDPAAVLAIEEFITRVRAAGTRLVLVTHDIGQARRLADSVLFMHRGRIVERAASRDFFDNPGAESARAFIEGRLVL